MTTSSRFAVAVHILTLLAQAGEPLPSSLIAGSVGTNPALIRRLIGRLAEAGMVTTVMGSTGGAALARPAAGITLLEVFRAVETSALISLHHAPNPACMVGREITGALKRWRRVRTRWTGAGRHHDCRHAGRSRTGRTAPPALIFYPDM